MRRARRHIAVCAALLIAALSSTAVRADCGPWPAWEAFKSGYISGDGRVIDPMHADQRTVSEGQAYAMMFALIANDRASFDRLLAWTTNNLARGDLAKNLPAWLWGKRKDGQEWGVLDPNAATDADVWLAYALLEAGRLWSVPRYEQLADALIANIAKYEVIELAGLGPTLVPAPHGFVFKDYARLNPSYFALQPLRRIGAHTGDPLWNAVAWSSRRVLLEGASRGVAGDWIEWRPRQGFVPDTKTQGLGSYDAIRVYLWIGMLDAQDPDCSELLARYAPVAGLFSADGRPPTYIDIATGRTRGLASGGFSASFVPFFTAQGDFGAVAQQNLHLAAQTASDAKFYYDQVLRLWGEGWSAGRYRFVADGSLVAAWSGCATR